MKRRVASHRMAHLLPIHPHSGFVIDSSKLKEQIHAHPFRGNYESARIPNNFVYGLIVDARELALIGKGNHNAPVERQPMLPPEFLSLVLVVEREFPFTIQVQPHWTYELWPGIFGPRYFAKCVFV